MKSTLAILFLIVSTLLFAQDEKMHIWDEYTQQNIDKGLIMYRLNGSLFEEQYMPEMIEKLTVSFSPPFPTIDFPAEILKFENLRELSIENTSFIYIPDELTELKYLEYLLLNNNQKLTSIPKEILNLENFENLSIFNSPIKDFPFIDATKKSYSIKHLSLWLTDITYVPEEIGLLTNLESLDLCGALGYTDEQYPDLTYNDELSPITELPSTIGNLENLSELRLKWSSIKTLPESIELCSKIHEIDLMASPNLSEIPQFIKEWKKNGPPNDGVEFIFSVDGLKSSDREWVNENGIEIENYPSRFGSKTDAYLFL